MFPAAHSMDTTWFAVDDDGHVAILNTSENGAYPTGAGPQVADEARAALEEWRAVYFLVNDRARVDDLAGACGDMDPRGQRPQRLCVLLAEGADHGAFERAFMHVSWRVGSAGAPRVLVSETPVTSADWAAMHDHVATKLVLPVDEVLSDPASDDDGVFHFRHDELGEPGAYRREGPARDRIRVDALPPDLVPRLGFVKLPLSFASAEAFHLADHYTDSECHSWGDVPLRGRRCDEDHAAAGAAKGTPPAAAREVSRRPPPRRIVVPAWALLVPVVLVALFLAYACAKAGHA